jgi:citrate lyase subunit beta/citryl-CoA lyase
VRSIVTWLFTPADNERALGSPRGLLAHARIIDLEDGCGQSDLPAARQAAAKWTTALAPAQRVFIRIHPPGPTAGEDIREAVVPGASGIIVPKVRSVDDIQQLDKDLLDRESELSLPTHTFRIGIIVETASGALALPGIGSASPRVRWLMMGEVDLQAELGAAADSVALYHTRAVVLLTSAALHLERPVSSVWTSLEDEEGLKRHAERAQADGFGGMLCVHPRQLEVVANALVDPPERVDWARRVLGAAERNVSGGAFAFEGDVIDEPLVRQARTILARMRIGGRDVR